MRRPLSPMLLIIILCAALGLLVLYWKSIRANKILSSHRRHPNTFDRANLIVDSATVRAPPVSVVIYNRVPKTGSTSLMNVANQLSRSNGIHSLHVNVSRNSHRLSIADQLRFARNVTQWHAVQPAIYHGHFAFIDFNRLGVAPVPWINVIREPLDRLVSYYYFLRYGDDFRPGLRRRRQGDERTFDECVADGGRDCQASQLWMQVPFFCGQVAECWKPASRWALEEAKRNLVQHYLVVGTTERLGEFIAVLDASLPSIFRGALAKFRSNGARQHMRKTRKKLTPTSETMAIFKSSEIYRVEREFYDFASSQFDFVISQLFGEITGSGEVTPSSPQKFFYGKIRPKLRVDEDHD